MNPIPRELASLHYYTTTTTTMTSSCSSPEMEASVLAVEKIIGYSFRIKKLLEEALTHSSFTSDGAVSYELEHSRNGAKSIASRHVDGQFVASASSEQKDIAKKKVLHELCGKKKRSKPEYSTRFRLSRKMDVRMEEKRIKHYSSYQKILLVGEGNFSFALSLATAFGSASNIVATSLDSKESLIRNYSRASTNLNVLENLGCTVVHEVDAHTMNKHPLLRRKFFDRIVFNFPHAGFDYPEPTSFQIQLHRYVVRGFLKSARKMLCQDGEIHVTHKTSHPFCDWKIVELAEEVELFLVEEVPFEKWHYPGYVNKKGSGQRCDKSFPVGECSTFKFSKAHGMESLTREVSALSI